MNIYEPYVNVNPVAPYAVQVLLPPHIMRADVLTPNVACFASATLRGVA